MKLTTTGLLAHARQQTRLCPHRGQMASWRLWEEGVTERTPGSHRRMSLASHSQHRDRLCPDSRGHPRQRENSAAPQGAPGVEFTKSVHQGEFAAFQPVSRKSRALSLGRWEFASRPQPHCPPGTCFIYLSPSRAAPCQDRLLHPLSSFLNMLSLPGSTMKGHPSLPSHPGTA